MDVYAMWTKWEACAVCVVTGCYDHSLLTPPQSALLIRNSKRNCEVLSTHRQLARAG